MIKKLLKLIKNSCFVKSFKELDKRIIGVMVIELALIISVITVFLISGLFLKTSINKLGISDEVVEEIQENMKNKNFAESFLKTKMQDPNFPQKLKTFLLGLFSNIIFLILAVLTTISFFKSLAWSKIIRTKFTKAFFIKFLILFLSWSISWILLFIVIALTIKETLMKYLIVIEFLFFIYFSLLLYPIFVKKKKVITTIKETFKMGLISLHKLALPILILLILLRIGLIIAIILSRIPLLLALFLIIYILFYISWIKFYMLKVIENIL